MPELSLNHVGQDSLVVTNIPARLPVPQQMDGKGNLVFDSRGKTIPLGPSHALIYVVNQPIRWRADGVAPTSAPGMGMFVAAGSYISWTDPQTDFSQVIQSAQFVRAEGSTGNGSLEISYFA